MDNPTAPPTDQPTLSISADRTQVTLALPAAANGSWVLDAAAMEGLISALIGARTAMQPPRPDGNPAPSTPIATSNRMRWYVEPLPAKNVLMVGLHHPGTGWVGIPLGREQAHELIRAIRRCAAPLGESGSPTLPAAIAEPA